MRDTLCSSKCITTCEVNTQITFRIQTENFMDSLPQNPSAQNSFDISPNFAFVANREDPDKSMFKSYSGVDFVYGDKKWLAIAPSNDPLGLFVDNTGFPLGLQEWKTEVPDKMNAASGVKSFCIPEIFNTNISHQLHNNLCEFTAIEHEFKR